MIGATPTAMLSDGMVTRAYRSSGMWEQLRMHPVEQQLDGEATGAGVAFDAIAH
jgi:hypothetical protein